MYIHFQALFLLRRVLAIMVRAFVLTRSNSDQESRIAPHQEILWSRPTTIRDDRGVLDFHRGRAGVVPEWVLGL